jgi:NAD(P)-dependent dehydrogenase (short-subunit alcohol dehydrogenase family)
MFDLSGKIVIVTGASGNLGAATARAFYTAGATLALVDRSVNDAAEIIPGSDPARIMTHAADLTDPDSVATLIPAVIACFNRIDVLANTVGGFRAGTPVHETPVDVWDFMLNLNAKTAFLLSQAVIPTMLMQQSGRIIHVSARAGLSGGAKSAAYSISKSAVIRLTESLSAELRLQGINVNCVLPGTIDTPQNRDAMPNADVSRWVLPEALADVIVFLASDAARAVTGAAIPVYGQS